MYWETKEWAHILQTYFRNTSAGKTGSCRRLQGMASPSPTVTPFPLQCCFSLFVFLYTRANLITVPVFSMVLCIMKAFPITQASFNNWGSQTLPMLPLKYRCGYIKIILCKAQTRCSILCAPSQRVGFGSCDPNWAQTTGSVSSPGLGTSLQLL